VQAVRRYRLRIEEVYFTADDNTRGGVWIEEG
jgi:hypothetical protein